MTVDPFLGTTLAILLLFVGKGVVARVQVLRTYSIPEALVGGVICALVVCALHYGVGFSITFEPGLRDALLLYFFAAIGLSSDLRTLARGGRPFLVLTGLAMVFLLLQNATGMGLAAAFGLDPRAGLMVGSVSLTGGVGTTLAWEPHFADTLGLEGAGELGLAANMVGLVAACVVGGPIAGILMRRHHVRPSGDATLEVGVPHGEERHGRLDYYGVLMALLWGGFRKGKCMRTEQVRIGLEWLLAMQNRDGGWSAFENSVDKDIVNHIPFNDLDNMLDPSTADITGHVLETLGHFGFTRTFKPVARGIVFLKKTQEANGSWWGRWGVNYIYGTHGALCGLDQVGEDMSQPFVRKAVDWLYSVQQEDGAWGEDCESYRNKELAGKGEATPSQTAWALLGLMAAGEVDDPRVEKGIQWLIKNQLPGGGWKEDKFTGTGFPNAFYLNYHFYREYFPLMALARYRNLKCGLETV